MKLVHSVSTTKLAIKLALTTAQMTTASGDKCTILSIVTE